MQTEIWTTSDNVTTNTYSITYSSGATWSTSTINVSEISYATVVKYHDTLFDMLMYRCPVIEKRKSIYEED